MLDAATAEPAAIRSAFSRFPSGVVVLGAMRDGVPAGLVASSFTVGVSLEPPLVLVSVQNSSSTWPVLRDAEEIGVSVLADGQEGIARQIAGPDRERRFEGVETVRGERGALLLADSPLVLSTTVHAEVPAGDHTVVLLRVQSLREDVRHEPIVFHGSAFRSLERRAVAVA